MSLDHLEKSIYNCPYLMSDNCKSRLNCRPIPGCGPVNPIFLCLGINPAARKETWKGCNSLETLKKRFVEKCLNDHVGYGKLLGHLENLIPEFRIPRTVYLTDIVKCPTFDNQTPSKMIEKYKNAYWEKTISAINSKFIIVLGSKLAKEIGGSDVEGGKVKTSRITGANYWFVFAPHPSQKSNKKIEVIAHDIATAIKNPTMFQIRPLKGCSEGYTSRNQYLFQSKSMDNSKIQLARDTLLNRLLACGFKQYGHKMVKGNHSVNIVCSNEFGTSIRVKWRRIEWANDYATIYDYSACGGPTCIVPLEKLFNSTFIKELKTRKAYANNKGYWTGLFPIDAEIAKLVLSHEERWDLL